MDITKRQGIVKVLGKNLYENEECMKVFFSNIYPCKIEFEFGDLCIITGFSHHFDILEEGDMLPSYEVTVEYHHGDLSIKSVTRL